MHKRIIEDAIERIIERKKIEFTKNSINFPFLYNMLFGHYPVLQRARKKDFAMKRKSFFYFLHIFTEI